ncbi:UTP--glucose-1-phosphate uridylyltransferase [Chloroflexi bacterium TSY]|nr:UTP--glucose-1-phosphate uridylyltransferase [Chloroflexi bacterium TSY]
MLLDFQKRPIHHRPHQTHYIYVCSALLATFISTAIVISGEHSFLLGSLPLDETLTACPLSPHLYLAIQSRGLLEQLLSRGYEYAFISNSDNLGAVVDINILGYFAACHLTFLMEVTRRTECDRKGGHLAKNADGHLILREVAQCPSEEMVQFQDIALYRFFNTNNLWLHLPSLRRILRERDGYLDLPLIRNVKSVDPRQANLPKVYQLETAMGAAIGLLPNVQALVVPRDRFLPVKNTNHLFALWSDAFVLDDDFRVVRNPKRLSSHEPLIDLDTHYFKSVDQLRSRWPNGVPSLLNCDRLSIQGNLFLSNDMNLAGDVCIQYLGDEPLYLAPYRISENNIQIKLNGELRTYPKSGCESDQLLEQDGVVTELFG